MGTPSSSSAGEGPPRVRSIRSHLTARLAVPVGALVVLCALAIAAALDGAASSPSGVDVFLVAAVGIGGGAPAVPARETIAYNLMKRQAAAALLG